MSIVSSSRDYNAIRNKCSMIEILYTIFRANEICRAVALTRQSRHNHLFFIYSMKSHNKLSFQSSNCWSHVFIHIVCQHKRGTIFFVQITHVCIKTLYEQTFYTEANDYYFISGNRMCHFPNSFLTQIHDWKFSSKRTRIKCKYFFPIFIYSCNASIRYLSCRKNEKNNRKNFLVKIVNE